MKLDSYETSFCKTKYDECYTVTASEHWSINKIKQLYKKYPEQVIIKHENSDGSLVAEIPKDWIRISPKRVCNLTDAQKKLIGERLKSSKK